MFCKRYRRPILANDCATISETVQVAEITRIDEWVKFETASEPDATSGKLEDRLAWVLNDLTAPLAPL